MEGEASGLPGRGEGNSSSRRWARAGEMEEHQGWVAAAAVAPREAQGESVCDSLPKHTAADAGAAATRSSGGSGTRLSPAAACRTACTTLHARRRGQRDLASSKSSSSRGQRSSRRRTSRSSSSARSRGSSITSSSSSRGRRDSNMQSSSCERSDASSRSSSSSDGRDMSSSRQWLTETSENDNEYIDLHARAAPAAAAAPPTAAAASQHQRRRNRRSSRTCTSSTSSAMHATDEETNAQQMSAPAAAPRLPLRRLPQKRSPQEAHIPPQANTARRVRMLGGAADGVTSTDAMALLAEEGKFRRPAVTLESLQQLNDVHSLLREVHEGKPVPLLRYAPEMRKVSLGEGGRELLRACLMLRLEGCNLQGASLQLLLDLAFTSGLWPLAQRIVAERATGKFSPLHLDFIRFKALQARLRKLLNAGAMLVTRGEDGSIDHVVYEPQKSLQLGRDGRTLLKAQLCRYISQFPEKAQGQLAAHGMASLALKHATVPQLLAVAWILDQWNLVVEIVRDHDEIKRRRKKSKRRAPVSPKSRGAELLCAEAEAAVAPRCSEEGDSSSSGAATCCSTASPSIDRRTAAAAGGGNQAEKLTEPSPADTATAAATAAETGALAGTAAGAAGAAARRTAATGGGATVAERSERPAANGEEGVTTAVTREREGEESGAARAGGSTGEEDPGDARTAYLMNEELSVAAAAASQRGQRLVAAAGEREQQQEATVPQHEATVPQHEASVEQQGATVQQQAATVRQQVAAVPQQPDHLIAQQQISTCAFDRPQQGRYERSTSVDEETFSQQQSASELQQQRRYSAASAMQRESTRSPTSDACNLPQRKQQQQKKQQQKQQQQQQKQPQQRKQQHQQRKEPEHQQEKTKRQKQQRQKMSRQQPQTQPQQHEQHVEDEQVVQTQQHMQVEQLVRTQVETQMQEPMQVQQERQTQQRYADARDTARDHSFNVQRVLSVLEQTDASSNEGPAVARHLLVEILRHIKLGVVAQPPPAVYCKLIEAARSLGVAVNENEVEKA